MNGEKPTEPIAEPPVEDAGGRARRRKWWRRLAVAAVVVVLVGAGLFFVAYRYNNRPGMSDAAFAEALDQAIERGHGWVRQHPEMLLRQNRNAALFYMLEDMDRLHPTPLFEQLVTEFMGAPASPGFWKRLIDPERRVRAGPMNRALSELPLDARWLLYALNPAGVKLGLHQEMSLFDPQQWEKRYLAHQLWALCHMRRVSGDQSVSDGLIAGLCERIAEENRFDIRVYDLYCERVAFLLMGGHAELINRRWVERMIENQRPDGGWRDPWYGFSSTPQWGDNPKSNEHTTLLALWALYQVKYADPEAFGLPGNR